MIFDYRNEQLLAKQRASTGTWRGDATGQQVIYSLVSSSSGRFHGGQPSNALSRAAWAHHGRAPGSKPR